MLIVFIYKSVVPGRCQWSRLPQSRPLLLPEHQLYLIVFLTINMANSNEKLPPGLFHLRISGYILHKALIYAYNSFSINLYV